MVIGLAVGLLAVFLRNADLGKVWASVAAARQDFLLLALGLTCGTFIVRAERWQYLLGPLGQTRFSTVFRTTVIGFAASAVLPARAGEVIRPYLLARREGLSATAAFATIVVERILDLVAVLLLLAAFLIWFDPGLESRDSAVFQAIRFGGLVMAPVAVGTLAVMFFMAGHPERLHAWLLKAEAILPARIAAMIARLRANVRRRLCGRAQSGPSRRRDRLVDRAVDRHRQRHLGGVGRVRDRDAVHRRVADAGAARRRRRGADAWRVGGFHEAYRIGATGFFGADNDTAVGAAIVLHAISVAPVIIVGLLFIVQDGLKLGGMARGEI